MMGLTELQWLYLILSVLATIMASMIAHWLGIQKGLDIFSAKLDKEIDKRMEWYLNDKH